MPIEWFDTTGVARIAGKCVVKVWPHCTDFRGPRQGKGVTYAPIYGWGYLALKVSIVEHGVGEIERASFGFEQYCRSRARVNDLSAKEHYAEPTPRPLAVLTGLLAGHSELPAWECEAPTRIEEELLLPMQRYIAVWL